MAGTGLVAAMAAALPHVPADDLAPLAAIEARPVVLVFAGGRLAAVADPRDPFDLGWLETPRARWWLWHPDEVGRTGLRRPGKLVEVDAALVRGVQEARQPW